MTSGFLIVDKPSGVSSNAVLATIKKKLGVPKAGHAGTLDPFATGVLVVALGEATRFLPYLELEPKTYEATLKLGVATDTLDSAGHPVREISGPPLSWEVLGEACQRLVGRQQQTPPRFSAKKISGKPAYRRARNGETFALKAQTITVSALAPLSYHHPALVFRCVVSGGTYARVLGQDLAHRLGTVGHLSALRRTAVGCFLIAEAVAPEADLVAHLRPIVSCLSHLPRLPLTCAEAERIVHGQEIFSRAQGHDRDWVQLWWDEKFLGVGGVQTVAEKGLKIVPQRLLPQL